MPALVALLVALLPGAAWAIPLPGALVEALWLYKNLDQVVVLDVRSNTESFSSRHHAPTTGGKVFNPCGVTTVEQNAPVYGHIPGARLIPLNELMVERELEGMKLRQMAPEPKAFQELMQRAGVHNDSTIIITSRGMNSADVAMAARLYWTLKYFGYDNMALLDGGTAEWINKKRRIRFYSPTPTPGTFTVKTERKELLATTADMVQWVADKSLQIVDVRSPDYFDGLARVEKLVASHADGHIPNAVNLPTSLLIINNGPATFIKPYQFQAVADQQQVSTKEPAVFYCNVGLQGSLAWFAWNAILRNSKTRLYDGSMHAWSQDPNREVAGF